MKFERIVVGVDFSPLSSAVLREARRLLPKGGALHVVHVVDASLLAVGHLQTTPVPILDLREKLASDSRTLLESLLHDEGITRDMKATREVIFGRPADVVVATAARERSDLVVVGAHGSGVLDRIFVGSVAEDVARRSPVPTLVVPPPSAQGEDVDRILVAIDSQDPATALTVLRIANDLAQRCGGRLEVIQVIAPPALTGSVYGGVSPGIDVTVTGELVAAASAVLDEFVTASLSRVGVRTHVLVGSPAREIVHHATPRDKIVCGTHAWGVLGRVAFGSVAAKVLRGAPCPVLVVGPHGEGPQARSG